MYGKAYNNRDVTSLNKMFKVNSNSTNNSTMILVYSKTYLDVIRQARTVFVWKLVSWLNNILLHFLNKDKIKSLDAAGNCSSSSCDKDLQKHGVFCSRIHVVRRIYHNWSARLIRCSEVHTKPPWGGWNQTLYCIYIVLQLICTVIVYI